MRKKQNRKKIITSSVLAGFMCLSSAAVAESLRIVSWGGAYQKGQSVGIFQPAAKAMGITVKDGHHRERIHLRWYLRRQTDGEIWR